MMPKHFGYAIDKRYLPLLLPFGLRPARDGVTLTDDGSFMATFGFFKLATPLANITARTSLGTTDGGRRSVFAGQWLTTG